MAKLPFFLTKRRKKDDDTLPEYNKSFKSELGKPNKTKTSISRKRKPLLILIITTLLIYYVFFVSSLSTNENLKNSNIIRNLRTFIPLPVSPHDIEPFNYKKSGKHPAIIRDEDGNLIIGNDPNLKNHDKVDVVDGVYDYKDDDDIISSISFYDLNDFSGSPNGKENGDIVLLLIPLRNAANVLPLMFQHLMNLTYPHDKIDIGFLISDCTDNDQTITQLLDYSVQLQNGSLPDTILNYMKRIRDFESNPSSPLYNDELYLHYMDPDRRIQLEKDFEKRHKGFNTPFRSITIYEKDFGQAIGQGFSDRHSVKVQAIRRKLMGRSRNWLSSNAIKPYHSWVYWRDADIEQAPGSILEDLMKFNKDVIVPNVWRPLPDFLEPDTKEQPYDLNSWPESPVALELAQTLDEDDVIVEGYAEYPTYRVHLAYVRDKPEEIEDIDENKLMDLDGIGGVSILVKAKVFRQGAHFSAFTFENHAETEAFGKMAKKMGFSVAGLPNYVIWHIFEPSEDDASKIVALEEKKKLQYLNTPIIGSITDTV